MVAGCGSHPSEESSAAQPSDFPRDVLVGLPPDSVRLQAFPLGEGDEPSISPDGRRIAYIRGQTVWLQDLNTGATRVICKNSNAHAATWNPSATGLAFQGDDSIQTFAKFFI
jgi:Tol biopolymer transport system component